MFAEESTPEQWIERAEDFMKHNLYEVAAKCYRCGEDLYMERVAMTHQKALNATRIKDNPSRMRNEFLFAADQYLEVGLPVKAAICLQNAREKELLAHLYEKMGQVYIRNAINNKIVFFDSLLKPTPLVIRDMMFYCFRYYKIYQQINCSYHS